MKYNTATKLNLYHKRKIISYSILKKEKKLSRVFQADIQFSNGVIQGVYRVLQPTL